MRYYRIVIPDEEVGSNVLLDCLDGTVVSEDDLFQLMEKVPYYIDDTTVISKKEYNEGIKALLVTERFFN